MWLLIAFIAVPLIEIALFIQVGGAIGLWPTLAIVILTAALGTYLVRRQGQNALQQVRGSFQELRDPTEPIAHGAMILFSAALLLTPGFFTDAVGFALLVPQVRMAAITYARQRIKMTSFEMHDTRDPQSGTRQSTVIEADFEDVTPGEPSNPNAPPSGWTRQ